jgi:RNA polymerase sigma-70 factor, ECF subfamily
MVTMARDDPRTSRRPSRPELELAGDAQLVIRVATGEEAALAELYRRHGSGVYGLALRLLGRSDLAEEVLQEVMVSLWERPDRFDPARGNLRPFLLRVAHGKALDRLRSETARGRREERHERRRQRDDADLEREVIELLRAETVREAVQTLSEGERRAIELAYFDGYSYREVAAILQQPEGTIKGRIRLGLRKLADRLDTAGLGPPRPGAAEHPRSQQDPR